MARLRACSERRFLGWLKRRRVGARGSNFVARDARLCTHWQRAPDHRSGRPCGLPTRWFARTGRAHGRFESVTLRTPNGTQSGQVNLGWHHVGRSARGWPNGQLGCRCARAAHHRPRPCAKRCGHCRPFGGGTKIGFLSDEFASRQV